MGFEPLGSGPSLQPRLASPLDIFIIPLLRENASSNVAQGFDKKIVETAY